MLRKVDDKGKEEMKTNYQDFISDYNQTLWFSNTTHDFCEISHIEMLLFQLASLEVSETERTEMKNNLNNAIGRIIKNIQNCDTFKTYGTTLYRFTCNNREVNFVKFLSEIKDKNKLFDLVRKRVANIHSDRVIGRYQALTEMRYQELGGRL